MTKKKISTGVAHKVPEDLRKTLTANPDALTEWEDITPFARNEWICWIESAKKLETRSSGSKEHARGLWTENAGPAADPAALIVELM